MRTVSDTETIENEIKCEKDDNDTVSRKRRKNRKSNKNWKNIHELEQKQDTNKTRNRLEEKKSMKGGLLQEVVIKILKYRLK